MKVATLFHVPWPENNRNQMQLLKDACSEVELVEHLGFDSAWFAEHHFSRYGLGSSSLMLMSNIAARTTNIRLGTAVLLPTLHNPIKLAEDTSTLDLLSEGRLDVGFGRGTEGYEYHGYSVEWSESQKRFREVIKIIQGLWTETDFEFDGEFYNIPKTNLVPRPVQSPHPPIYIAATRTPETLDFAINTGFPLLSGPVADTADALKMCENYVNQLKTKCVTGSMSDIPFFRYVYVGKNKEEIKRDTQQGLQWTFDMIQWRRSLIEESEVNKKIDDWRSEKDVKPYEFDDLLNNRVIVGTPDECIEKILSLKAIGVEHFGCNFAFGGIPHETVKSGIELFASEVMPYI